MMDEQTTTTSNWYLYQYYQPCPHCTPRCPYCGRPYQAQPYYPQWPYPASPWYGTTTTSAPTPNITLT